MKMKLAAEPGNFTALCSTIATTHGVRIRIQRTDKWRQRSFHTENMQHRFGKLRKSQNNKIQE